MLYEKIAFNNLNSFSQVDHLISKYDLIIETNFVRRKIVFYQQLKEYFKGKGLLKIKVKGGNWGLASNALHLIDLCNFLTSQNAPEVFVNKSKLNVVPSKRVGYLELTGTYILETSAWSLELISESSNNDPHLIMIRNNKEQYVIDEIKKVLTLPSGKKLNFKFPYQSQLTNQYLDRLMICGNSGLTNFEETKYIHKIFFENLSQYSELMDEKERLLIT